MTASLQKPEWKNFIRVVDKRVYRTWNRLITARYIVVEEWRSASGEWHDIWTFHCPLVPTEEQYKKVTNIALEKADEEYRKLTFSLVEEI